jgi:copper chaperone NosL
LPHRLNRYHHVIRQPIRPLARLVMAAAAVALLGAFVWPLWTMSFESNQYPDPLRLAIHVDHLEGQKTALRDDLREINSLNHYIGMRPLLESDFSEFLWLPFVIGFFVLIILRALVFGAVRDLADVTVLFVYFALFSAWNFWHRLYLYGHNLEPDAAIRIEPFTPPLFGRVQVANFWVESFPGGGSYALALAGLLLAVALVVAVQWGRVQAREELGAG